MKKAMIEVQFNWVFILIVGIGIMLFFVGATFWYKSNEEKKIASDVMVKLQTAMTGAGVSSRTASEINIPRAQLEFLCDANECSQSGCASSFTFENTGVSKDTSMDIIFTQKFIKSNFLHTWTQEWKTPYKTTNFLYFSSPEIKYYLVYKEGDASETHAKAVAANLKKNSFLEYSLIKETQIASVPYNNEYLMRFIIFSGLTSVSVSQSVQEGEHWDAIFISGDSNYGTVTWGKSSGQNMVPDSTSKFPYLGMPSLIGAIYSEEFSMYVCNMKKAILRLKTVNNVYLERTKGLYSNFVGDGKCEYYYDSDTQNMFVAIDSAVSNINAPSFSAVSTKMNDLEQINSMTIRKSCPRLY